MSGSGIRVVLFDLDDTLFAHRRSVELAIATHRTALGLPTGDDDAEHARWVELEERHYHRYLMGELDFLGQRRARARDFVAPFGHALDDAAADAWWDAYLLEYERSWALHDDVGGCLDALEGRGIRVGLITNGDLAFQSGKVHALGLVDRVEHLVASGDVGVAKPDARIFQHACRLFGVAPADAVYVGDRLHTDAIGAAGAGLAGVWLDRAGAADDDALEAASAAGVRVIRSLDALPALLS